MRSAEGGTNQGEKPKAKQKTGSGFTLLNSSSVRPMFSASPSLIRKLLLAPAALAYAAASAAHRALWLRPRRRDRAHDLPLIVIGSLRAGGAGKTPVTLELARHLRARGLRVGILAYRIHASPAHSRTDTMGSSPLQRNGEVTEIFPGTDWRTCSDEAVLLARRTGARVFATRDRGRAWELLSQREEPDPENRLDVLVSDDGLMDSRLRGAFRVAITDAGSLPGILDLLPAGPYRLTGAALKRMGSVLRLQTATAPSSETGTWFHRKTVLPRGFDREKPCWVLCGLGNPPAFLRALRESGVRIAGSSAGPDHGLPDLAKARRDAARAVADQFLCSEKDGIKLEGIPEAPEQLFHTGETVTLSPDFLDAVRGFLTPSTS